MGGLWFARQNWPTLLFQRGRVMYLRRLALAAITAPPATLALYPGSQDSAPGLHVLRTLPSGLLGAICRAAPRTSSLEASVLLRGQQVHVHLCGGCHLNPESAHAAGQAIRRHAATNVLKAVALECDTMTLELIGMAHQALRGLPRERVRVEGLDLVRQALFDSPRLQALAREAGAALTAAAHVPLPAAIAFHLERDGVLWGAEMAEAAEAATEVGARIVCLASPVRSASRLTALGFVGSWLRARALVPGFDERSCDMASVEAGTTAIREMAPAHFRAHVLDPDRYLTRCVRELCDELTAGGGTKRERVVGASVETGPCSVLVVVGAGHVPGMVALLLEEGD